MQATISKYLKTRDQLFTPFFHSNGNRFVLLATLDNSP